MVGFFGSLIGAEFVYRAFISIGEHYELTGDPILFYRLTGPLYCLDAGAPRTQTEQRVRGLSIKSRECPPATSRVAWVGDSACFGCAVGDEETAPHLFQTMPSEVGTRWESINFGVPGYNVRQVREVVKQRCPEFRGLSAVVYYHHLNDIVNAPWAELAPFLPSDLYWKYERPGNTLVRWLKRSALVRSLGHTRLAATLLRPQRGERDSNIGSTAIGGFTAQCVSLYANDTRHGVQFRDDLNAMADDARRQGADLVMVYFPIRELLGHALSDQIVSVLEKWCAAKGILFVDVSAEFLAANDDDLYVDDTHPGLTGQRIVARSVRGCLEDRID